MKYVIIVNGKPESGKTAFEIACKQYLDNNEYACCSIISTIDPIKNIYRQLGWDGRKTDKARKDLSALKKMWIDNCNGPLRYVLDYVLKLDNNDGDHVVFVDIREESEIVVLSEALDALQVLGIKCHKILVERPDIDGLEYGNKSDDMAGNNKSLYDIGICNSGDLNDLDMSAKQFIEDLLRVDGGLKRWIQESQSNWE